MNLDVLGYIDILVDELTGIQIYDLDFIQNMTEKEIALILKKFSHIKNKL